MKIKIMALAYIILIGSLAYSDNIFLTGELELNPSVNITGFNSRTIKAQPALNAEAGFHINFNKYIYSGLSAGINYTWASNLEEGWSYPGFSGFEAGLDLGFSLPFFDAFSFDIAGYAGWYRYNLTENLFFLPSAEIMPGIRFYDDDYISVYGVVPVRYFFHRQADIFMSAGAGFRVAVK